MMRYLLPVALLILLPQNAGAQQPSASRGVTAQAASAAEDNNAARQMADEPREVWRAYDNMASMPVEDRKRDYQALSSSMKASVWAHHLRKMLVEHPEFTPEQVGLINEYLSLLTPELFQVERDTTEWWISVDAPLQELAKRSKTVFDSRLARTMFADLAGHSGELRSDAALGQTTRSSSVRKKIVPNTPVCECSTAVDFCIPGWKCIQGGCYFTSQGCGPFWQYSCTGLCLEQHGGS